MTIYQIYDETRRPGSDLLSRALRQSTISAVDFHGRVRDGIGWGVYAITTWSPGSTINLSDHKQLKTSIFSYALIKESKALAFTSI